MSADDEPRTRETGRDRYFAAKERELDELLDPATGLRLRALRPPDRVPALRRRRAHGDCSSSAATRSSVARTARSSSRTRRSTSSSCSPSTAAGARARTTSGSTCSRRERQLELDRAKFAEILDELEPYRGDGRLLDVGHLDRPLPPPRARARLGRASAPSSAGAALAYARDELGLEVVRQAARRARARAGELRRRHAQLRARAREPAARAPRRGPAACSRPAARSFLIVPNVDSLACRVLHERAATFDGRNHLRLLLAGDAPRRARPHGLRRRRDAHAGRLARRRCSSG